MYSASDFCFDRSTRLVGVDDTVVGVSILGLNAKQVAPNTSSCVFACERGVNEHSSTDTIYTPRTTVW